MRFIRELIILILIIVFVIVIDYIIPGEQSM